MINVISLLAFSKKYSRDAKKKQFHKHCVAIQAYDGLVKRQLEFGKALKGAG